MSELDRSPSLRTMLGVGSNMLRRYTGLAVTVYLIQLALSLMAAWAMAHVLAGAYEHRPLFDSAGRRVRALSPSELGAGLRWDGRADSGRAVASGVYYVRVEGSRGEARGQVVVAR